MDNKVSIGTNLTAGGSDLVFTCPPGYSAEWVLFYCINNTASSKAITCKWYDASKDEDFYIFQDYPLSAKNFIMFDSGAWVRLNEGDIVTVSAEAGAAAHSICSFILERAIDDAAY